MTAPGTTAEEAGQREQIAEPVGHGHKGGEPAPTVGKSGDEDGKGKEPQQGCEAGGDAKPTPEHAELARSAGQAPAEAPAEAQGGARRVAGLRPGALCIGAAGTAVLSATAGGG